ncbi:DUF4012 domain-containing protein [Clavibacter tessellarius]|uniref:DUF4012 domain-containing protein n=1 Tax=Clavibacter tessellarius TaxID=31965 RepID=UPI003244BCD3
MPALLGADGARNYLLMFQNNAEVRSTGGNPAALVLLTVEDGAVRIAKQASSNDFPRNVRQGDVPDETVRLVEPRSTGSSRTSRCSPTPRLRRAREGVLGAVLGDRVDGVLSFDPIALSYLLEATGPITLATGDVLDAQNAVPVLLGAVCWPVPDELPRAGPLLRDAAGTIFAKLVTDTPPVVPLVTALDQAIDERRPSCGARCPRSRRSSRAGR